ncbi:MAG: hypothetical protein C5B51_03010 [Terriglobia bacterium]|nr:MAG: hypothetical protein C5B51_03010 [Terriglobia bacterium]
MSNPFEKRATEYLRDDEAFLSVVTPAPLFTFFEPKARDGVLFDRLVVVIGTPGSGKTTIATLLRYQTMLTLQRTTGMENRTELILALSRCGAMRDGEIVVCGCRLPLESEYRDFWELPYPDPVKTGLMHSLLQARAVISWLQSLREDHARTLDEIEIVPKDPSPGRLEQIGGTSGTAAYSRACEVEREIYRIGAALVAPKLDSISRLAVDAYAPFEVIEKLRVHRSGSAAISEYQPLVILDDAHSLHPQQVSELLRWLARREQKASRWVLMRLDSQTPQATLLDSFEDETSEEGEHGPKVAREVTTIWLQRKDDRRTQRTQFRTMARQMADRYLRLMETFNRSGIASLANLLDRPAEPITTARERELSKRLLKVQEDLKIPDSVRKDLEREIAAYFEGAKSEDDNADVRLAMLRILMYRFARRVPQVGLFEAENQEPSRPVSANSGIADGARVQLMHEYSRPYYFGMDVLCDASSENAEIFLQLAGRLVSLCETRIIRSSRPGPSLSASLQHKELRQKAAEMIDEWRFPERKLVRLIVDGIAAQCIEKALEPTASLEGGPNAFGIPQEQFEKIPSEYPRLADVLKYGVGYNAIHVKQDHGTKHATWCLVELGGIAIMKYGLSFRRGNFLERTSKDLAKLIGNETA